MFNRLALTGVVLAIPIAAYAGDGTSMDGSGAQLIRAVVRLFSSLSGMF
jgi:hypothetical protein